MTGFALGDKFIGVSTDNIYTKQELDTKLQDKQDTLIAGQGIDISEDGTISSNTNLDVSNPLELAYPQLPNHGISLNDDGTFRRVEAASNLYAMPNNSNSTLNGPINFSSSNLSGQSNNTIPINNYDGAYSQWDTEGTITHEMLVVNQGGNNELQDCFVFGTLEDNIFTMKAKLGFYPQGASVGSITTVFTQGTWDNKIFNPTSSTSGGTGDFPRTYTDENYYMKFGLNDSGNYAITIYDKATNTPQVSKEYTFRASLKPVLETCNCVLLPFGYVDAESSPLHYDPEYNKVLSSTGSELWTATIPNTSVTPTLQLNYDSTLTLNGDNLRVNTSNLGLATVATTGSYTDLTNTPEEYVLPTASTDTLGGVKVDGTSIVIADGVISTNTGTGVDTYTKVEVNNLLSTKQDTITPSSPLSITKEVRSNLEGFQYTTDSTGVYTTGNYYWSAFNVPLTFTISSGALPGDTLNPETFSNKIVIPYSLGQVVKVPTAKSLSSLNPYTNYIFGKLLQDGTFVPIVNWHINPSYLIMKDTPSAYGGTYGNTLQLSYIDTGLQNPTASEQIATGSIDITFSLIQMREDVDGSIWVDIDNGYVYGVFQQNQVQKYQYHYTNTEYVNRLKEINSCILAPVSNNGMDVNNAIQVEDIGLYANPGNLYNLITSENYNNIDLGENLFDLSGEQAYNYLDLSIGAGLSISEGVLVNNNPIPYELPTASAETLGGVKVDGTSIVISDGVISTNTGTEVDTYTKGEIDAKFASKQDTLSATSPVVIQTKTLSNSEGFYYTTDSSGIYATDTNSFAGVYNNSGYVAIGDNICVLKPSASTVSEWSNEAIPSRVVIPYSFGQVIKCPGISNPGFAFFGYDSASDYYYPIYAPESTTDCRVTTTTTPTSVDSGGIKGFNFGRASVTKESNINEVTTGADATYIQLIASEGQVKINIVAPTYKTYHICTSHIDKFKEINSFIIIPRSGLLTGSSIGYSEENAISIASIGLYSYDGDLYEYAYSPQEILTENLFDLSDVQRITNIQVNVDNSTIKVNGSGQLYANIELPENVITSDNISTNAYIQQLEQRITALESLIDGGNSLGEIITNTVIQTAGTPAGGQNSGYVGTQTITVKDLEIS